MHDVNVLDLLLIEAGAFYIMDRGYLDFERLYALDQVGLLRHARQQTSMHGADDVVGRMRPLDHRDEPSPPTTTRTPSLHPGQLRFAPPSRSQDRQNWYLTTSTRQPRHRLAPVPMAGRTITQVGSSDTTARRRFYGPSENAVRTQIWIAISVYVLVAIIKKQLRLDVTLHTLLQILSLTLFEKLPMKQAVAGVEQIPNNSIFHSQLNLFEF